MDYLLQQIEQEFKDALKKPKVVKRSRASEIALVPAWPCYWFLREVFEDDSIRDSVKYDSRESALDACKADSIEWE